MQIDDALEYLGDELSGGIRDAMSFSKGTQQALETAVATVKQKAWEAQPGGPPPVYDQRASGRLPTASGSRRNGGLKLSPLEPPDNTVDERLAAEMSGRIYSQLDPKMAGIARALGLAAYQRTATAEHGFLAGDQKYRAKVMSRLMAIARQLPEDDPIRQRTVRIGLLSGVM